MTIERFERLVAASPACLVALLVGKLWWNGTLGYYVNDRTLWIVIAGGVLFAIVGVVALWSASRDADSDAHLSWKTIAFLIPVLVGLIVPARPLSATSGQASSLGALGLTSHVSSGGAGDTFGYWLGAISTHADPGWWSGQRATLVGFATPQIGLPHHSFIVGRYLVTCCVVDATLLGFPVQMERGKLPGQGTWVQVTGIFGRHYWTDPSGAHYPLIEHARVTRVSIPSSPYLSP